MSTIGDFIDKSEADRATAKASADAAILADKKAADDSTTADQSDTSLVVALKKTGDITVSNQDGTFSTYTISTSSAGDKLVETMSKGKDTVVPDDSTPPTTPEVPPEVPPAPNDGDTTGDTDAPGGAPANPDETSANPAVNA